MATTEINNSENGTNKKPRWKRPKEKENFTEAEMRLIETSRAVMEVIQKQKERGDFDEIIEPKEEVMEINQNNKSGEIKTKPRWKRPKEKKKYTEAEMRLIETTREVLKIIREMKEEGAFDDILKDKSSKV